MSPTEEHEAWLEREGEHHVLRGDCSVGRARLNTLVLDSPKVSRLHPIIHLEGTRAFWLVDLGSSNGTFLNKRRIHEPVRLRDQDQIVIGGNVFTFRQLLENSGKPTEFVRNISRARINISRNQWQFLPRIRQGTVRALTGEE
jgi:pSer/pThr/pTyr-binding forkhead associated (FHA) protein